MAGVAAPICLDAGGYPSTVVTAATATGTAASSTFALLARPTGGVRNLYLSMGPTAGTVTTATFDVEVSYDGGVTWDILESGIDLVGAPAQQVAPPPPVGASLRINVATITGAGATVNVVASSN